MYKYRAKNREKHVRVIFYNGLASIWRLEPFVMVISSHAFRMLQVLILRALWVIKEISCSKFRVLTLGGNFHFGGSEFSKDWRYFILIQFFGEYVDLELGQSWFDDNLGLTYSRYFF